MVELRVSAHLFKKYPLISGVWVDSRVLPVIPSFRAHRAHRAPGVLQGGVGGGQSSLSLGSDLGLKSPPPALDASGLTELLLALPAAVAAR